MEGEDFWSEALKFRDVDKARVASIEASREYNFLRSRTTDESDPHFLDWVDECNELLEIAKQKEQEFMDVWRDAANQLWRQFGAKEEE